MTAIMRVGIPKPGGQLVRHARHRGYPTLFSANALVREDRSRTGADRVIGWQHDLRDLESLADAALDSAGFVAWARYGGFRWSVEAYVELAGRLPWSWWAQMDACCEREIAGDADIVRLRQAETLRLLDRCRNRAAQVGVKPPMPVLQGATVEDYVWHARRMDFAGEKLCGVGSSCRRPLGGRDGLAEVIRALDAELPAGVRLHLFGVKSAGIAALGAHPRVESVDSQAWDLRARVLAREAGKSSTMAHRCEVMDRWVSSVKQTSARSVGRELAPVQREERPTGPAVAPLVAAIMADEVELRNAMGWVIREVTAGRGRGG